MLQLTLVVHIKIEHKGEKNKNKNMQSTLAYTGSLNAL